MPAWLTWTFAALVAWGAWAAMSKLLGASLSAEQTQALSTLGFLPIIVPLALAGGRRLRRASPRGILLALAGGVASCLGNIPYYAALAHGAKFATVTSLAALAPLVTVILAVLFLRERLSRSQVLGVFLAGTAIWLFNLPDSAGLFSSTVLVALLPIALWGLSGFLQKLATDHVSLDAAAISYLGAFLPMGVFYGWTHSWPEAIAGSTWVLVLAMGFCLAFGNYAVLAAYSRRGKASVIAPIVNLFPVVAIGIALLLGEEIAARESAGIVLALLSVAALSREARTSGSDTPLPGD